MAKNPFLNELKLFSKDNLNPTSTKISYANGKQFMINSKESEEKEIDETSDEQLSSIAYWSKSTGYVIDLIPDNSIDEIVPRLYLSGDDPATNKAILDSKKYHTSLI